MIQDDKHLVFIIGVGRSGTTLLQSMLNAHPDVCFPPETHFFRLYVQNHKFEKLIRQDSAITLSEHLKSDTYLRRLKFDIDDLFQRFRVNEQVLSADRFYLMLLSKYAQRQKKKIVGDKDPRNIEFVSDLHRYFPNASIIHTIRDPRDVIVSRMKADWSKDRNFWHHVFAYKVQIQIGRQMGNILFKDRYLEVIYEQLLNDPAKILRKVSNFLHIPYSSKMLDFSASAKEIINHSELQWKKEALGPLLKNNQGKWRSGLTKSQILFIEQSCSEVFFENPYRFSDIHMQARIKTTFAKIASALLSVLCVIYRKWRCR
jgi:hypothetical protein